MSDQVQLPQVDGNSSPEYEDDQDEDEENISSPTFAPRRLAGVTDTIFRMGNIGASSSMFNAAINSHNVDATGLCQARTQMRSISAKEFQDIIKYGSKTEANDGPNGQPRFRYEHNNLACVTDTSHTTASVCNLVSSWKYITSYRHATSRAELKLIVVCREVPKDVNTAMDLIDNQNVDMNVSCSRGLTPLMMACEYVKNDTDLLKYLLSLPKVDLDYPSTDGNRTALHWSVHHGSIDAVKLLIVAGANVTVQDSEGKTPLDLIDCTALSEFSPTVAAECRLQIRELLTTATDVYKTQQSEQSKVL